MTLGSPPAPAGPPVRTPRSDRAGLLAVDKPAGLTSHEAVEWVAHRLRLTRAGHLGTLDPGATGLLLVATGAATRCVPVWQGGDKTYEATVRFGVVTSTQDVHGQVLERSDLRPDRAAIVDASRAFVGELEQTPPMVSAIRVGGQRLHRLARRGIEVERAPRRVTVKRWEWLGFEGDDARCRVVCTPGTYVRTLAHDLGRRLGCGAALASLRRLRSEPFGLERALPLRDLATLAPDEVWARAGLSLEQALEHLPALRLDEAAEATLGYGGRPACDAAGADGLPVSGGPRSIVLRSAAGRVLALGELVPDADRAGELKVCPHVVMPWAVRQGRPV